MRLFFVMGAPKSGTTWLQAIMNAHPQVSCFGEGHFIEQVVLPIQAVLQNYNRQLAMVSALVYEGAPHYAPLTQPDINQLARSVVVALIQRAGPAPQSLWWGDKTPAYSAHLPILDRLFPRCRFIDILRDPRDVAVSMLYQGQRSGVIEDVPNDSAGRHALIVNAATRWLAHVKRIDDAAVHLGNRLLRVRYQDLVRQPQTELRRLFAHLDGVAVTDQIIEHVQACSAFVAMSGGRQPGDTDDRSFFRRGIVGAYASELRPAEIDFIEDRLGESMRAHGLLE